MEKDFQIQKHSFIEKPSDRPKSSLRMRYKAEVDLIRKNLGGLETLRESMGLSRRKMCQLLLVDPSAWTRWTRDESKVPPHVWKTLSVLKDQTKDGKLIPNLQLELRLIESQIERRLFVRAMKWGAGIIIAFLTLYTVILSIKY